MEINGMQLVLLGKVFFVPFGILMLRLLWKSRATSEETRNRRSIQFFLLGIVSEINYLLFSLPLCLLMTLSTLARRKEKKFNSKIDRAVAFTVRRDAAPRECIWLQPSACYLPRMWWKTAACYAEAVRRHRLPIFIIKGWPEVWPSDKSMKLFQTCEVQKTLWKLFSAYANGVTGRSSDIIVTLSHWTLTDKWSSVTFEVLYHDTQATWMVTRNQYQMINSNTAVSTARRFSIKI